MMKYNVVFIIENISLKAGIERAVVNVCNGLSREGHTVTIISLYSTSKDKPYFEVDRSISIINIGKSNRTIVDRLIAYLSIPQTIKRVCKRYDFVVGTTHGINCSLRKLKGIRIACEHFNYDSCPSWSKKVREKVYPKLDAVVLLTHRDAEKYTFIEDNRKYVIPNIASFTCDTPSKLDTMRIIAAGRLTYQKGFDLLINAGKIIKEKMPGWHVDIFGEGEDYDDLLDQIRLDNLSDFIRINRATKNIKNELLNSSIYVMTSRFEGLPMILIEAQTCGLPIVSFDCPEGPSEIIEDGKNGYLVPMGDVNMFVSKLEMLKNNQLRQQFGAAAYENSKNYTQEKIISKWLNMLSSLTKENR